MVFLSLVPAKITPGLEGFSFFLQGSFVDQRSSYGRAKILCYSSRLEVHGPRRPDGPRQSLHALDDLSTLFTLGRWGSAGAHVAGMMDMSPSESDLVQPRQGPGREAEGIRGAHMPLKHKLFPHLTSRTSERRARLRKTLGVSLALH